MEITRVFGELKVMEILIADDDQILLKILQAVLTKLGYDVKSACDGEAAWELFTQTQGPKLSILDWMMPKMNGIEVCKKMKALDPYAYVILLTSVEDEDAISTAVASGADDFIPKPFNKVELQARLEVGKRFLLLYNQLLEANIDIQRYANEMETLAQEKARQLIHSDRLSSLGVLTAGMAHEINNPTSFISGNVQILQKFWPIQERMLKSCPQDHSEYQKLMFICKEMPGIIEGIQSGTRRIGNIVSGLKSFARQDTSQHSDYDLHQLIDEALLLCNYALKYNVTVEKLYSSAIPILKGNPQKIEQVFVNLFNNAADAMAGSQAGSLTIRTDIKEKNVTVSVSDNGKGLDPEALNKIWVPFFTTKPVGKGTGLGMSISLGIIESHGGKITAANKPEGGAEFVISLPANA